MFLEGKFSLHLGEYIDTCSTTECCIDSKTIEVVGVKRVHVMAGAPPDKVESGFNKDGGVHSELAMTDEPVFTHSLTLRVEICKRIPTPCLPKEHSCTSHSLKTEVITI